MINISFTTSIAHFSSFLYKVTLFKIENMHELFKTHGLVLILLFAFTSITQNHHEELIKSYSEIRN